MAQRAAFITSVIDNIFQICTDLRSKVQHFSTACVPIAASTAAAITAHLALLSEPAPELRPFLSCTYRFYSLESCFCGCATRFTFVEVKHLSETSTCCVHVPSNHASSQASTASLLFEIPKQDSVELPGATTTSRRLKPCPDWSC